MSPNEMPAGPELDADVARLRDELSAATEADAVLAAELERLGLDGSFLAHEQRPMTVADAIAEIAAANHMVVRWDATRGVLALYPENEP